MTTTRTLIDFDHHSPEFAADPEHYYRLLHEAGPAWSEHYDGFWVLGRRDDVAVVAPLFHQGRLVGFAECMAHMADIGGCLSGPPREVAQNPLRVHQRLWRDDFQPLRVIGAGHDLLL